MVKIRLRRMGAKKAPFYRVVVADSRFPRDGRFIEEIGTYDPCVSPAAIKIDAERAQAWIKTGAQPTETVRDLLKKAGRQLRPSIADYHGGVQHNGVVQALVRPLPFDGKPADLSAVKGAEQILRQTPVTA